MTPLLPSWRWSVLLGLSLVAAFVVPAAAHEGTNHGTIKVHDNETENPAQRNVPHVDCDFWIEGFNMSDDAGTLVFYSWPPTGNKSVVMEAEWEADSGTVETGFHFNAGPFNLTSGHYRVEAFVEHGHPGDEDHFAKAKTFWVDCPEQEQPPPCPPNFIAVAQTDGDIHLDWGDVEGAVSYNVYRAENGGDFDFIANVEESEFTDTDTVIGVTYEYEVRSFDGEQESVLCATAMATAIPLFPGLVAAGLAVVGGVAAFAVLRRRDE